MVSDKTIPKFLTARSPSGLQRRMGRNNGRAHKRFHYFDFQEMQDGNWICWYYDEINIEQELEKINDESNREIATR